MGQRDIVVVNEDQLRLVLALSMVLVLALLGGMAFFGSDFIFTPIGLILLLASACVFISGIFVRKTAPRETVEE